MIISTNDKLFKDGYYVVTVREISRQSDIYELVVMSYIYMCVYIYIS